MDDSTQGTEPPTIESQDAMNLLSSAAEWRAFKQFQRELGDSSGDIPAQEPALKLWLREHSARWRRRRQQTAAQMQAEEIRKYRWIESEKLQRDIGKTAHIEWVRLHAAEWRKWFENSYDGPLDECD